MGGRITFEYNLALVRWVRDLYGPGTPFRSGVDLSRRAGRSRTTISYLEKEGRATAEVIIDLARAADASPLDGLVIAGFLTDADRGVTPGELDENLRTILDGSRRLSETAQLLVLGAIRGLINRGVRQDEQPLEAEGHDSLQARSNG